MLVHELVLWNLFCYYFMCSLEERFRLLLQYDNEPLNRIFSCGVCFQLGLYSRDKKLLQEVNYYKGLEIPS